MTTRPVAVVAAVLLAWASGAGADEAETIAMRSVRLTTEAAATAGCTRLGSVRDDSVKDLRRKIVRIGGDTALLRFGIADMSTIYADVFRCPPATSPSPRIPPPPPGLPPPPPPGPSR